MATQVSPERRRVNTVASEASMVYNAFIVIPFVVPDEGLKDYIT